MLQLSPLQVTGEQTWYNLQRSMKPQTFKPVDNVVQDPFTDPATQCVSPAGFLN